MEKLRHFELTTFCPILFHKNNAFTFYSIKIVSSITKNKNNFPESKKRGSANREFFENHARRLFAAFSDSLCAAKFHVEGFELSKEI